MGQGYPVAEEDGSRPSGARIRDGRPVKVIHPRPRGGGRDGRKSSGVGVGFLFLDREGLEWVDEFNFFLTKSIASRLMNLFLEKWTIRFHWERA